MQAGLPVLIPPQKTSQQPSQMALRSDKDRAKAQQEKFQAILSALLKDEDNKYCEDCDAKGPRWAAWNLGIFLCIRCAGIHRNLGVHISRVKSVNLDSWTPEQVAMMQEMGNSQARAVYEANVPDAFRRPQTDSALEAFIRAKYEQKKYIAREWIPPKPVIPKEWLEDDKSEKKKPRSKPASVITLNSGPPSSQSSGSTSASTESKASTKPIAAVSTDTNSTHQQVPKPKSGSDDLLGLDAEIPQNSVSGSESSDLLADLFGGSPGSVVTQGSGEQNGAAETNLFESGVNGNAEGQGEKRSAKDSIMALYGSGGQPQVFGIPESERQMSMPVGLVTPDFGVMASIPGTLASGTGTLAPGTGTMSSHFGMLGSDLSSGIFTSYTGRVTSGQMDPSASKKMTPDADLMPRGSAMVKKPPVNLDTRSSTGMAANAAMTSNLHMFSLTTGMTPYLKMSPSTAINQMPTMTQNMGMMAVSSGTLSGGPVSVSKPGGAEAISPSSWSNNPFLYPGADLYQSYNAFPIPYYSAAPSGGMYMPQQQMYGGQGMNPLMHQQAMMGQPMQQAMMGMPQQAGSIYGGTGQIGGSMIGGTQAGMMGRPGGQMFMQPQGMGQQFNPMQQQMQFQQMQQQMANMTMGGGQMGGMQQPQQTAVVGGTWGSGGTGQTLSTNLWQ